MIKSLPELPKSMKHHVYRDGWRRKAGMLRAMFLISKDSYQAIVSGTLETEEERTRAMSRVINYTAYASSMSEILGTKYMNLIDFVHDDENWK
jgi:hypothetical protein